MRFLPLVDDPAYRGAPGWCTYAAVLEDGADVEILCGGMNTKLPTAAGIWRQGDLLHFGFQPAPDELNATGRALLENCIVYIARFTDDRPIGRTPSVFVDREYPRPRGYLRRALAAAEPSAEAIAAQLAPALRARVAAMPPAAAVEWLDERFGYLVAGTAGLLELDGDALALGLPVDRADFPRAAGAALDSPATADAARRLLERRMPDGPGSTAGSAAWREFVAKHEPFLFFSETGGQHWWVDPLARARGVPTAALRGAARAAR